MKTLAISRCWTFKKKKNLALDFDDRNTVIDDVVKRVAVFVRQRETEYVVFHAEAERKRSAIRPGFFEETHSRCHIDQTAALQHTQAQACTRTQTNTRTQPSTRSTCSRGGARQ